MFPERETLVKLVDNKKIKLIKRADVAVGEKVKKIERDCVSLTDIWKSR